MDPEGIPLAITILAAPGKTLPNFLEFSASTLTLSGKTTKKNLGDYEFLIRATDNNAQSVDVTISLTVKFISECYFKCHKCSGPNPNECLSCLSGFSFLDNQCLDQCPDGRYSHELVCIECDPKCRTCFGPNSNTECVDCVDGSFKLDNGCYAQCPIGYYPHQESGTCLPCS